MENKNMPGFVTLAKKAAVSLQENGLRATIQKVRFRLASMRGSRSFVHQYKLSEAEKQEQKNTVFDRYITISILVPLYNTPEKYLREMIDSVLDQTYSGWQLCLADGSDEGHAYVGEIAQEYAERDPRIKYKKLEKNEGISGNSNRCIEMADGDYIALFDHDDLLHPAALFEVMEAITLQEADFIYTDELTFEKDIEHPISIHCKPNFAIDTLRANNYICHFTVFDKKLLEKTGGFREAFDGSQDFDLVLRLTEQAKNIAHIPKVLYFWRSHEGSVASDISVKPYCVTAGCAAVQDHLDRLGIEAKATPIPNLVATYRIAYKIQGNPKISIIIPSRNGPKELAKCVKSILNKSTYPNYEIVIVENNSTDGQMLRIYKELERQEKVRIVTYEGGECYYAQACNFGAKEASGEYLVFLHSDTQVITKEWMEELLMYAQRDDVGAVGAKLYYPNDTVEHAGIVVGIMGSAGRPHHRVDRNNVGYMGRLCYAQDLSAVSSACMMVKKAVFDNLGGFDEDYLLRFADVDLCLRIREEKLLVVYTPFAELYHMERSVPLLDKEQRKQRSIDRGLFTRRWSSMIELGDPYYNPNFSPDREDFILR